MRVPLLLDVEGAVVVCAGAGPVAAGKVVPLVDAGAHVVVVAPQIDPALEVAAEVRRRTWTEGDLATDPRPRLAVAATGDRAVDDAVAAEARELGIWCLRTDGEGDVAVPSVVRRGDVLVAVATGVPALTRRLRQVVEGVVDDRWAAAGTALAALRADPAVRGALAQVDPSTRRTRWRRAVEAALSPGGDDAPVAILRGER